MKQMINLKEDKYYENMELGTDFQKGVSQRVCPDVIPTPLSLPKRNTRVSER